LALNTFPIFKEEFKNLIKNQLGGIHMSFFNSKIAGDRRSGKDRRMGTKSGNERRSGKDRRMSLYDRLPEGQRNTVEIIIKHLEEQAG
jgi:hypothetical protein